MLRSYITVGLLTPLAVSCILGCDAWSSQLDTKLPTQGTTHTHYALYQCCHIYAACGLRPVAHNMASSNKKMSLTLVLGRLSRRRTQLQDTAHIRCNVDLWGETIAQQVNHVCCCFVTSKPEGATGLQARVGVESRGLVVESRGLSPLSHHQVARACLYSGR